MNSTVGPIFNEKIDKNEICGSVNSAEMHCSRKTGQMLQLLFMYSTWTVVACEGENAWKKKKKIKKEGENAETEQTHQTHYPNITLANFSL